ncbi:hypothetical protein KCMC57_up11930 [Kitasatospora sp. CMC57]|uniref:Uncharacterized protein n=1 Tax=Kitasatospora sp. CMC57 TaxID=3231513 RepID=A0AB33JTP8_9ACTN
MLTTAAWSPPEVASGTPVSVTSEIASPLPCTPLSAATTWSWCFAARADTEASKEAAAAEAEAAAAEIEAAAEANADGGEPENPDGLGATDRLAPADGVAAGVVPPDAVPPEEPLPHAASSADAAPTATTAAIPCRRPPVPYPCAALVTSASWLPVIHPHASQGPKPRRPGRAIRVTAK